MTSSTFYLILQNNTMHKRRINLYLTSNSRLCPQPTESSILTNQLPFPSHGRNLRIWRSLDRNVIQSHSSSGQTLCVHWPRWTAMCVHIDESGNRRANKQTNKSHSATRGLFREFCRSHIHFWDWLLPTSLVASSLLPLFFRLLDPVLLFSVSG